MTLVRFFRKTGRFVGFEAKGHTGYAPSGQDIVCAGISTLLQTAVLGLKELADVDLQVKQEPKSGLLICRLGETVDEEKLAKADLILNLTFLGLQQIVADYRKYVQISFEEVQENEV
ncbi:MAG: ribosomal-processing cysteine protease Prp [Firmicutes bacterium]|nr:ribosomal-processing cysteine protease Prp [Bacillota bacterium]